jgi:hypothetical protein
MRSSLILASVTAVLGLATSASAGGISGAYAYSYAGSSAGNTGDVNCSAPNGNGTYDTFTGAGGTTTNASDTISFSACNIPPSGLAVGTFIINDGDGNFISGDFEGTSGSEGVEDGVFTILAEGGTYSSITDGGGTFEDTITGGLGIGTGNYVFSSTPEPVSVILTASGIVLIGFRKKFRNRRNS